MKHKHKSPFAHARAKRALKIHFRGDSTKSKGNTPPHHISFYLGCALQMLLAKNFLSLKHKFNR